MKDNDPAIPNVWICLQKIRGFLDGVYDDKKDVYECLDAMEHMFKELKLNLKDEGKVCRGGWLRN